MGMCDGETLKLSFITAFTVFLTVILFMGLLVCRLLPDLAKWAWQ